MLAIGILGCILAFQLSCWITCCGRFNVKLASFQPCPVLTLSLIILSSFCKDKCRSYIILSWFSTEMGRLKFVVMCDPLREKVIKKTCCVTECGTV